MQLNNKTMYFGVSFLTLKMVILAPIICSCFFPFSFSFFSRYVLLAQPDVKHSQVQASAMEETLLLLRFPKSRVRRRLASATIPRHHSNRKVHIESGFEM